MGLPGAHIPVSKVSMIAEVLRSLDGTISEIPLNEQERTLGYLLRLSYEVGSDIRLNITVQRNPHPENQDVLVIVQPASSWRAIRRENSVVQEVLRKLREISDEPSHPSET